MLLYKIKSGAISSAVNLVSIPSSLTVTYQTNTQVNLGACTLTATFAAGVNQGDWLPLGVVYDQTSLKAYRYGEGDSTACSGESLTATSVIDLKQGATGVDISYAYVYLFSEWLTPGEVLFYSFHKLSRYYVDSVLITGYSFYLKDPNL